MAKVICVMGESGSGKTTSLRNLNPKETFYIDCDKKGLSWRGWKKQYSVDNRNYIQTDFPELVQKFLSEINTGKRADGKEVEYVKGIKNIIIDTLNGIMVGDEMRRAKEKGYDKWQDLAQSVYLIIDYALSMRDDLNVIFLAHTQTERTDDGSELFTSIKTNGRKLNKIGLETKFTTVLLAKCVDGKYIFETNSRNSTAKSPMGAFDSLEIENDMIKVLEALEDF